MLLDTSTTFVCACEIGEQLLVIFYKVYHLIEDVTKSYQWHRQSSVTQHQALFMVVNIQTAVKCM